MPSGALLPMYDAEGNYTGPPVVDEEAERRTAAERLAGPGPFIPYKPEEISFLHDQEAPHLPTVGAVWQGEMIVSMGKG